LKRRNPRTSFGQKQTSASCGKVDPVFRALRCALLRREHRIRPKSGAHFRVRCSSQSRLHARGSESLRRTGSGSSDEELELSDAPVPPHLYFPNGEGRAKRGCATMFTVVGPAGRVWRRRRACASPQRRQLWQACPARGGYRQTPSGASRSVFLPVPPDAVCGMALLVRSCSAEGGLAHCASMGLVIDPRTAPGKQFAYSVPRPNLPSPTAAA
jgi:hypothetical protein